MVTERLEHIEHIIAHQEIDVRDEHGKILEPKVAKRMYDIQWILAVGMTREQYKEELSKRYGLSTEDTEEDLEDVFEPFNKTNKPKKLKLTLKKMINHPPISFYEIDT